MGYRSMKYRVPQTVNAFKEFFRDNILEIARLNFTKNNFGLNGAFDDNYKNVINIICQLL